MATSKPKTITIGNASTASYGSSAAGDQGQKGKPDYSGEVRLKDFTTDEFMKVYRGWHVNRPVDADRAHDLAKLMIEGCNNPHIGYGTTNISKVNTTTDSNADCSGLVSKVVSEVYGTSWHSGSEGFWTNILSVKDGKKQAFYKAFDISTWSDNPIYNGDIISIRGTAPYDGKYHHHVLMVVSGSPREGQPDESPGATGASTEYSITPTSDWDDGWGVTIFAAKGDSGQPNVYGVANPSVNCHATSVKDNKGFISVAAGKEWPFNTRFEIKQLPGVVFQVDDRGNSNLFDGQKHLDIFVNDNSVEEYVTTSDGKKVGLMKFAGAHQWYPNKVGPLSVRQVSKDSTMGSSPAGGGVGGGTLAGYLEVPIEYTFVPRNKNIEEKDEGFKYYQVAYKNEYGKGWNGSYAWGRFSEVCQSECNLSKGYPRKWYINKEDKYPRGAVPSLGAVMCFTHIKDAGDPGFVCVVEIVHPNYIYVSYKDKNNKFWYKKMTQADGTWNLDLDKDGIKEYLFQGFIYCPNVSDSTVETSLLQKFVQTAVAQDGDGAAFTKKYSQYKTTNGGWSAAFVNAVARVTGGLLSVIIPDTCSASTVGLLGVQQNLGTWFSGPAIKGGNLSETNPQVGDIALFRSDKNKKRRSNIYECDYVGIVTSITTDDKGSMSKGSGSERRKYKFTVIVGDWNSSNKATSHTYYSNSSLLSGIFRPAWSRVDGTAEISKYIVSPLGMYNEGTTIEDAAIRDISYAKLVKEKKNTKYEPSIKKTGITLSAINYTGMLSNMYSVLMSLKVSADDDSNLVPTIWSQTELSELEINLFATEPHPLADGEKREKEWRLEDRTGFSAVTDMGKMIVNANAKTIFTTIYAETKNKAATVGIMGVMWWLSQWEVDKVDIGLGLLQWRYQFGVNTGRAQAMKEWCKTHGEKKAWDKNLSGQLDFLLKSEAASGDFKTGWKKILKVEEIEEGAEQAAKFFYKWFIMENDSSLTVTNILSTQSAAMQSYIAQYGSADTALATTAYNQIYEYVDTAYGLFIGE